MDLGLAGRSAILMASSRGLGRACAHSVAREGVNVVINGRTADDVRTTADDIASAHGVEVDVVVGDATEADTQDELLAACPEPDIVLLNGGGPPLAALADIEPEQWQDAAQRLMISPLVFVQRVVAGMRQRRFGRIVAITSAMVKAPNPALGLSAGPRLGMTAVLKALSTEIVMDNVTINQLLPERIDTERQQYMARMIMDQRGISWDEARAAQAAMIKAQRLGRPEEFGDAFAFLCSAQAGYISGQNLQLDGGSYAGVF
jgi:3-oxoacyl-[acyl-carrier protein] reductase